MIVLSDCMAMMKGMNDNSVKLTLTDIPYDVVNRESCGLRQFDKGNADILTFDLNSFIEEVVRVTSGSIYVFSSTEQVSFLRKRMIELGLITRLCILEKTNPSPANGQHLWLSSIECCVYGKKKKATFNEHCKSSVWRYPTERNKLHPTQKPLKLFQYLIQVSSNEGDVVFDPCAGSGTTPLAAKLMNRQYLACDIDPNYVEIANQRLKA